MTLAEHTTAKVVHDDLEIFYRRFGKPGACPVLIVHGLSYFSYDWIAVAHALAKDREVVAIDMRGFGDSGRSPERHYRLKDFSGDLIAVLDHLQWPRAILVGHSMGGRVSLCTAAWHQQRVAGLAAVDFAPDVAAEGRMGVAQRIGNQPDFFESVDHALQYHGHNPALPADAPLRKRYEAFLKPVDGKFELKRDLHFRDGFRDVLQGIKQAPEADLWSMVRGLTMPTLFLRGSHSDMFAPETMDKLRRENPRCEVQEIDGGHNLAGDNPQALTAMLQTFFQTI